MPGESDSVEEEESETGIAIFVILLVEKRERSGEPEREREEGEHMSSNKIAIRRICKGRMAVYLCPPSCVKYIICVMNRCLFRIVVAAVDIYSVAVDVAIIVTICMTI